MSIKHEIILLILILLLITTTLISKKATATSGTATFYDKYFPSACYGYEDHGEMIAAADPTTFNNGAACGSTVTVTCTGATNQGVPHPCYYDNEVTVTIVDLCKSCDHGQFDLSEQAFSSIANTDAGKIRIHYSW